MQKRKSHIELNQVYFWTSSIKNWISLLEADIFKEIIISSLQYLVNLNKIKVYAYVIMPNHIHFIWEMIGLNGKEMPLVSFHKYTAHQFLKTTSNINPFKVKESGRSHRFWQRDALAFLVNNNPICEQKIDYIHLNPLQEKWNLVKFPEDYRWSSASFYEFGNDEFNMLTDYRKRL